MKLHLATALVSLAACYGSGPAPSVPKDATVVFEAPFPAKDQECSDSRYIGPVAIADDKGYAIVLPYQPLQQNCGSQGPSPITLELDSFAKNGATPGGQQVNGASLEMSMQGEVPWLATDGADVLYSYYDGGQAVIGPVMVRVSNPANATGNGPGALWIDSGGALYGAWGQQQMGGVADPDSPQYPGDGSGPSQPMGELASVPLPLTMNQNVQPAAIASSSMLECAESRHCVVTTATGVFFVTAPAVGSTSFAQLHALAKATGTDTVLDFPGGGRDSNLTTVGLDSDGTTVVASFAYGPTGQDLRPGCWIYASQGDAPTLVFQTTAFSCMDATIDGDSVYFAIVHGEGCDCGPPVLIHGDGIGRVSLSDASKFESIAVKMAGIARGPRRVYVDADAIYAVDPLVIARIAKTALDGAHDFTP